MNDSSEINIAIKDESNREIEIQLKKFWMVKRFAVNRKKVSKICNRNSLQIKINQDLLLNYPNSLKFKPDKRFLLNKKKLDHPNHC